MGVTSPDQFAAQHRALEIIHDPSTPEMVSGSTARQIMKAANMRSWPISGMASEFKGNSFDMSGDESVLYPHETVHTAQSHLHVPTLRRYLNYDEPEHDEEAGVAYHPEVAVNRKTGSIWMDEGHHRVIASRLRGDLSREAWKGDF